MKANDLDEVLGIPARLAIVATLMPGRQLSFTTLGEQTGIAAGNLHVQTRKLVDAGYIVAERGRQGGRGVTRFEITERGRLRYQEHVRNLRDAIEGPFGVARAATDSGPVRPGDPSRVW